MQQICAIVVTYFPDEEVRENLAAVRPQVDHIIVVDNGSPPQALGMLRILARELKMTLIENSENLGIAAALNQGVRAATEYEWIVLFDQDSRVRENFISNMMLCAASYSQRNKASLWIPRYFDMRFKNELPPILAPNGTIAVAMTSGSLMRRSLIDDVGYFEDLFIYEVDYEFSLRIRKLGHTIHECPSAVLDHSPGEPIVFSLFGKKLFQSTNYKPSSRYYLHRNGTWLRQKYGKDFPEYFRFSRRVLWKDVLKMLLAEKQKLTKLRFILKGRLDAWRGNMERLRP